MPSMRFSTRSRRLENTMVPSLTVTRSIENAVASASPADAAGCDDGKGGALRSRRSGTLQDRTDDGEFGDLGLARPQARPA